MTNIIHKNQKANLFFQRVVKNADNFQQNQLQN
jgi:hypothetical protein